MAGYLQIDLKVQQPAPTSLQATSKSGGHHLHVHNPDFKSSSRFLLLDLKCSFNVQYTHSTKKTLSSFHRATASPPPAHPRSISCFYTSPLTLSFEPIPPHSIPPPPTPSSTSGMPRLIRSSQFRFRRLQRREQQIPDIARRLIEIEAHPLAAKAFAHDVELDAVIMNRVSHRSQSPKPDNPRHKERG